MRVGADREGEAVGAGGEAVGLEVELVAARAAQGRVEAEVGIGVAVAGVGRRAVGRAGPSPAHAGDGVSRSPGRRLQERIQSS